jgi:Bacterial sugar transferase
MTMGDRFPDRPARWADVSRRAMDPLVSRTALVLLAPWPLAIALWARRNSPGPTLLRQKRIGQGRRPFTLNAFRSMHIGCLDMLRLDETHVRHRGVRSDVSSLLRTTPSMLRGDGAR